MASIGNLVVNLTAKTDKFRKGMSGARRQLASFAKASFAIGGVAGAGMLKLAADAEVLEVKMRVLLKSGDKAKTMIEEISQFAAATPFQKMEIGEAAQKLLAFNVPAGKVMDTLKNIGDISALTGNRISEMAELYGKANVQGRLFGEDINQLTGRGIPIIQELAKQFGVAESEVKGLVEAGKVSAANIETAFQSMTASGGQFAGGMAERSKTTAGKPSTRKDHIAEPGTTPGKVLLP
ncbi:MAG: tape measure protein, partial [Fuerstiella sp.]|nr:tape measure protein [Fuerstiella sp.]